MLNDACVFPVLITLRQAVNAYARCTQPALTRAVCLCTCAVHFIDLPPGTGLADDGAAVVATGLPVTVLAYCEQLSL